MPPFLEPTPAACILAAAAIVAGAPWFASGLRALRLRRHLAGLRERPLAEDPIGFVLVRGRVALESPLVGPLSGRPCAAFRLEIRRVGPATLAAIEERRCFRLVAAGGAGSRVCDPERALWDMPVVAQRALEPEEPLTANLAALIARSAEAAWLRRCGVPLILVERSLVAGQECFVIGSARHARPEEVSVTPAAVDLGELAETREWSRTGTDDVPTSIIATTMTSGRTDLWIEAHGHLDFLRICQHAPDLSVLAPSGWRAVGVALGPLLGIAGLLFLAAAADRLRGSGF
jgi:hypothetical protein